jgi:hypothetical protein
MPPWSQEELLTAANKLRAAAATDRAGGETDGGAAAAGHPPVSQAEDDVHMVEQLNAVRLSSGIRIQLPSDNVIRARYRVFGGSARFVLGNALDGELTPEGVMNDLLTPGGANDLVQLATVTRDIFLRHYGAIQSSISAFVHVTVPAANDDERSQPSLFMQPVSPLPLQLYSSNNLSYVFASPFAKQVLFGKLYQDLLSTVDMKALQLISAGAGKSLAGDLMEFRLHQELARGGAVFRVTDLETKAEFNVQFPQMQLQYFNKITEVDTSKRDVYYVADRPHFPFVDAVISPRIALQMTVSRTHHHRTASTTEVVKHLLGTDEVGDRAIT